MDKKDLNKNKFKKIIVKAIKSFLIFLFVMFNLYAFTIASFLTFRLSTIEEKMLLIISVSIIVIIVLIVDFSFFYWRRKIGLCIPLQWD